MTVNIEMNEFPSVQPKGFNTECLVKLLNGTYSRASWQPIVEGIPNPEPHWYGLNGEVVVAWGYWPS